MMHVKKTIRIMLMLTLIASLFVACSSKNSNDSDSDKTELNIAWWGTNTHHDKYLEVIELFEEKHPNVKIVPEYSGWEGYWEKLATKTAGGNLPDLIQMDFDRMSEFASRELIQDLQPYIDDDILNFDGVNEDILEGGKMDDILYAVPLGVNVNALFMEPDLFEEAGVDPLEPGYTWEDYFDKARELKEKLGDDHYVISLNGLGAGFRHYLIQNDLHLYNEDNTSVGYDDDVLIDFLEMWQPLREEDVVPSAEMMASVKGNEDKLIIKEIAPIDEGTSSQVAYLDDLTGKSLELMIYPTLPNAPKGDNAHYLKPSVLFSITRDADDEKAELAAEFIEFFLKSEDANDVLLGLRGKPIFPESEEYLRPKISETGEKAFDYVNLAEEYSSPIFEPSPAGHGEVDDLYQRLLEEWRYDQITSEDFAKQFREGVEEILN